MGKSEVITYSLRVNHSNSGNYHRDVGEFTRQVIEAAANPLSSVIYDYLDYIREYNQEVPCDTEEYLPGLLSFGILWRIYSEKAIAVQRASFRTMARMAEWRKKQQRIKPLIDFFRGILLTFFISEKSLD